MLSCNRSLASLISCCARSLQRPIGNSLLGLTRYWDKEKKRKWFSGEKKNRIEKDGYNTIYVMPCVYVCVYVCVCVRGG